MPETKIETEDIKLDPIEKNYLDQIEAMKIKMETMVEGTEYDKLVLEHKKLTEEYISKRIPPTKQEVKLRSPAEISAELRKMNDGSTPNRKFLERSLEYRDSYMKETGLDPFAPNAGLATPESIEVASALKSLLEENLNNEDFNFKLQQVLYDSPETLRALKARERH